MGTSNPVFRPTGGKAPRRALATRAARKSAPRHGGVKQERAVRVSITEADGDSSREGERKRKAALAAGGGSFVEPSPPAAIVLRLPKVRTYPLDVPTKRAVRALFDEQVDGLTRKICGHAAKVLPTAPKEAALGKDEQAAEPADSADEEDEEEELPEGYQKGWYGPVPSEE
jgi:hypothetical protein